MQVGTGRSELAALTPNPLSTAVVAVTATTADARPSACAARNVANNAPVGRDPVFEVQVTVDAGAGRDEDDGCCLVPGQFERCGALAGASATEQHGEHRQ